MKIPGFNPCFNGSVERGRSTRTHYHGIDPVSILVLMEVLREDIRPRVGGRDRRIVSILVLMEVLREVDRARRDFSQYVVSILVLMEVLREGVFEENLHRLTVDVSILVLMEVLREGPRLGFLDYRAQMFQSLF